MNVICKNLRQQLKEIFQYIGFLERENKQLRKQIEKLKHKKK